MILASQQSDSDTKKHHGFVRVLTLLELGLALFSPSQGRTAEVQPRQSHGVPHSNGPQASLMPEFLIMASLSSCFVSEVQWDGMEGRRSEDWPTTWSNILPPHSHKVSVRPAWAQDSGQPKMVGVGSQWDSNQYRLGISLLLSKWGHWQPRWPPFLWKPEFAGRR